MSSIPFSINKTIDIIIDNERFPKLQFQTKTIHSSSILQKLTNIDIVGSIDQSDIEELEESLKNLDKLRIENLRLRVEIDSQGKRRVKKLEELEELEIHPALPACIDAVMTIPTIVLECHGDVSRHSQG